MDDLRSAAQAVVDAEYGSVPLDGTLSTVITSELADLGAAIAALRAALDAAPPSGRGVFWDESAHVPDYTATLVRDGKGGVIGTKVYLPAPPAGLREAVKGLDRYGMGYDRNLMQVLMRRDDGDWVDRDEVLALIDAAPSCGHPIDAEETHD